jgi:hypothetical protein
MIRNIITASLIVTLTVISCFAVRDRKGHLVTKDNFNRTADNKYNDKQRRILFQKKVTKLSNEMKPMTSNELAAITPNLVTLFNDYLLGH